MSRVKSVDIKPGGAVQAEIAADLGSLEPRDVTVQLWVAPTLGEPYPVATEFEERRDRVARDRVQVPHEGGVDAVLVARGSALPPGAR